MKTDLLFQTLYELPTFPDKLKGNTRYGRRFREEAEGFVTPATFTRKQLLLSEGQQAETAYFVNRGLARGYLLDEDGKEISLFFWKKSSFAASFISFFLRIPSEISIEITAGTELLIIPYGETNRFLQRFPEAESVAKIIVLQYLQFLQRRLIDQRKLDIWQRYQKLKKDIPGIANKVSYGIIASYIGATKTSLSRALSQHHHKKY